MVTIGEVLLPTCACELPFLEDVPEGRATIAKTASGGRSDMSDE